MDISQEPTTSATQTTEISPEAPTAYTFASERALPVRLNLNEFDGSNVNEWFRDTEKKLNDLGIATSQWTNLATPAFVGMARLQLDRLQATNPKWKDLRFLEWSAFKIETKTIFTLVRSTKADAR